MDASRRRPRINQLKQALADHGVRVALGEGFIIMPGRNIADAEADFDLMAELGAERLNVCAMDPDPVRNLEQFSIFASLAADRDLPVTLEFMPATPVPDLAAAVAFVGESAASNAAVLVDAMHFFCSGGTNDELRNVPDGKIGYAQLCDAKQASFYDGYFQDARQERPLPGLGVLPLGHFLHALPPGCPIGLEIPSVASALAGVDRKAYLTQALDAAEGLLQDRVAIGHRLPDAQ
ncbi:sugar phosphate isomerase/epimerase [Novosphingobium sp. ST904]|uniref:sugar phosphate isomerase/epimerase family protein n=1 Tax=Novosphingobium sp. ST904 TaxID=1684385 RepID=UPI0006C859C3|nr:TIM barrel protein [Novosphingobium sp. ST904]